MLLLVEVCPIAEIEGERMSERTPSLHTKECESRDTKSHKKLRLKTYQNIPKIVDEPTKEFHR